MLKWELFVASEYCCRVWDEEIIRVVTMIGFRRRRRTKREVEVELRW